MEAIFSIARRVKRSFTGRSGGMPPRLFSIAGKLTTLGLGKAFEHIWKMGGFDSLRLRLATGEAQHGVRDFVLTFTRQETHDFEGFFHEFCDVKNNSVSIACSEVRLCIAGTHESAGSEAVDLGFTRGDASPPAPRQRMHPAVHA